MTVCIAAIARNNTIVTASDLMISGALSSADSNTVKLEPFHRHWAAMLSADDLTQCIPIIDRAKDNLKGKENTLRVVRACFKKAYQQHVSECAADEVLGRFDMSMSDFLKNGKDKFTDEQFNSLSGEIRKIKGKCDFLIWGYDRHKTPHIFQVSDPGIDSVYDKPGFCAIGSGCYAAEGMLMYLGQSIDLSMEETIFNVCAAKFMAEKVGGVGEDTFLFVKQCGFQAFSSQEPRLVETIRDYWEKGGKPRVPDGVIDRIVGANIGFIAKDSDD